MTQTTKAQFKALARELAAESIVTKSLARFLEQVFEAVHEQEIKPLREAAEFARSAIDKHLGDSDLPNGSDDPLFIACQKLSEVLR